MNPFLEINRKPNQNPAKTPNNMNRHQATVLRIYTNIFRHNELIASFDGLVKN